MRRNGKYSVSHRLLAGLLCLCMITSVISGVGLTRAIAAPGDGSGTGKATTGGATSGVTREADSSTMDDYKRMLNFAEDTRYAGRLWTDKTVFALGYENPDFDDDWDGTTLTLNKDDDGLDGNRTITLDEDFLHVFSTLGSTLEFDEAVSTPIDLVILLDMSGSMGTDVVDGNAHSDGGNDNGDRVQHSRIQQVLNSINQAIQYLMSLNPTNRVCVVGYGGTAYTLLPLDHYTTTVTKTQGDKTWDVYLSVGNFRNYISNGGGAVPNTDSAAYTVRAYATGTKGLVDRRARNDYATNQYVTNTSSLTLIGFHTNLQAGIYQAFNELYNNLNRVEDVTYTYESALTGESTTVPRIPVAFVMTDGGSNYAVKAPTAGDGGSGDEWYNLTIPDKMDGGYSTNVRKYRAENNKGSSSGGGIVGGGEAVILDILMTASYMKSKVLNKYNELLKNSDVADNKKTATFPIHTISVDTPEAIWQIPRVYAALDPKDFFTNSLHSVQVGKNTIDPNSWGQKQDVLTAYSTFQNWSTGATNVSITFRDSDASRTVKFNQLSNSDPYGVTREQVVQNIEYNDSFSDIDAADLEGTFRTLLEGISEELFAPVGGGNDLGVDDSVTYMDPIGKYMDVKDVTNLLIFGELYDITKTAVYDYQWNHQYMSNEKKDNEPLNEGWYKGEPGTENNSEVQYGGKDAIPKGDDGTGSDLYSDVAEAWAAGWVYRLNYQTASQFVPTLNDINTTEQPSATVAKQRNTVYTFYRINDSEDERTKLRMNPAYGEKVPDDAPKYNGENQEHLETPGVYALADLRIWVETTNDFSDSATTGTLSDTNYDEALWVNIPVNMLPLRKVTIHVDLEDNITYETYNEFPLRVFYTVGVSDSVLDDNGRINIAGAISAEYVKQNKVSDANAVSARGIPLGNLEFFSNWYNPLNRYSDYATTGTDYTFGDPVVSFSPSTDNRFYIFEKALPLYNTAYVWVPTDPDTKNPNKEYQSTEGSWRLVSLKEDYTGTDVRTFDPTSFGGRLLAQDLVPTGDQDTNEKRQKAIWEALNGKSINTARDGDIILLQNHRLDDVDVPTDGGDDPFASENYYYLAIEYYELSSTDKSAQKVQYVIARKGSEFGSAYQASGITNGDMLVWHDISGKNEQDYPYLSFTETGDRSRGRDYIGAELGLDGYYKDCDKSKHQYPSKKTNEDGKYGEGIWVVCAKPGGLRVGALAQNIQRKEGDYVEPEGMVPYIHDRYAGSAAATTLSWGYYADNVTRTANNYYLPTISTTSDAAGNDIVVNVYLGNNGRLYVMDTTLLVTKLIDPSDGGSIDGNMAFNFQLYIQGITGPQNAVVVRYNATTKSWQRQFHYIDLELDNKLFLQAQDGNKATVDKDGCQVIPDNENGGYMYAAECTGAGGVKHSEGDSYDGDLYYVYIGPNQTRETGAANTAFRVYHNSNVDEVTSVGENDVIAEYENEVGKFYATKVWLVTQEQYETVWANVDPITNSTGMGNIDSRTDLYTKALTKFELLTIDPNISETTDISIITPYRTNSSYWTKVIVFGKNANLHDGGPSEAYTDMTVADLYDQIIPSTDRADYFANLTNQQIAANTAEFTLKHGEALLFSGIPSASVYRVTEKLTDDQVEAGYSLKEIQHNQQQGSVSTYRPGAQLIPVYINEDATYGTYYPTEYQGSKTEKGLTWALNQSGNKNDAKYLRMEPFHHTNAMMWESYATMAANAQGDNHHQPTTVDDGSSPFYLWDETKGTNNAVVDGSGQTVRHTVQDNPSCKPLSEGGADLDMKDGTVRHYMFKDGEMVDFHYEGEGSGFLRNIGRYIVSPTVHFGVVGEKQDDAALPAAETKSNTNYNHVYSVFGNTGTYEESANFINTQSNDKTETQINGNDVKPNPDDPNTYPGVQAGDVITYEVKWANTTGEKARVVIIDPLDAGVDFKSADPEAHFFENKDDANKFLAEIYKDPSKPVTVDSGHVVIWDLGIQDPETNGAVTLNVTVNDSAEKWWDYDGDGVADAPVGTTMPDDYLVRNRATVRVADNAYNTNTVQNPVGKPDKTETNIHRGDGSTEVGNNVTVTEDNLVKKEDGKYHGPVVFVGDIITYEISWRNYENTDATITIRDPLDENVSFEGAEFDPSTFVGVTTPGTKQTLAASTTDIETSDKIGGYGDDGLVEYPAIVYDKETHTVTYHLGKVPAGASGKVTLKVKVLSTATPVGHVDNYAGVTVGNNNEQLTRTIENPTPNYEKTETTPGDGVMVEVGQLIPYNIKWDNYHSDPARVIIMDTLDPGVDFENCNHDGIYSEKGDTLTFTDGTETVTVEVPPHTVYWVIQAEGYENGTVELTVKVNENAKVEYTYNDDADGFDGDGTEKDYEVLNQARVKVGNDEFLKTDIMENPVPEKTETQAGDDTSPELTPEPDQDKTFDGPLVEVGDEITYEIHWTNGHDTAASVTITDPLDPNVDFVSAGYDPSKFTGVTGPTIGQQTLTAPATKTETEVEVSFLNENNEVVTEKRITIVYDAATHTVTYNLGMMPAHSSGTVTLTVKVNESARNDDGKVINKASVKVGNDAAVDTETIVNPTPEYNKTETHPGDGVMVQVGQEITYEIKWNNYNLTPSRVIVMDTLDPGVDWESASPGGTYYDHKDEIPAVDGVSPAIPIPEHTVVWIFDNVAPGAEGTVELKVTVNENAKVEYTYNSDADGFDGDGTEKDYEVLNQARVKVGNDEFQKTQIVENPVPEKTETQAGDDHDPTLTPGNGNTFTGPLVEVGDVIEYQIHWTNGYDTEAAVSIRDPLDNGVDFLSAVFDPSSFEYEGAPAPSLDKQTLEAPKTTTEVPAPGYGQDGTETRSTITYTYNNKEGKWVVTFNLGVMPAHSSGTVTLRVRVNDSARGKIVDNTAYVQVGNDDDVQTEIVENPVPEYGKTETIPGNGVMVNVGDPITYEITWQNYKRETARVIVMDTLDPGVDFVFGSASADGEYYEKGEMHDFGDGNLIEIPDRTVVWVFEDVAPQHKDSVKFKVTVNERAKEKYTYNDDASGLEPGSGKDYEVLNQARIKVGNDAFQKTQIVENPVPEKTETQAGTNNNPTLTDDPKKDNAFDGPLVQVGDEIRYEIHWTNGHDESATVTITDPLDKGVDFVGAEFDPNSFQYEGVYTPELGKQTLTYPATNTGNKVGGYFVNDVVVNGTPEERFTIVYDAETHTVTFNLGVVPAHSSGTVTLIVKVNSHASTVGSVENTAAVKVGNDAEVNTETIVNPTPKYSKTEETPGDGVMVEVGQEITYNINWQNYQLTPSRVIIMDTLDPGVDFVKDSATNGGVYYEAGGKIEASDGFEAVDIPARTVVWIFENVDPGKEGTVEFKVTVNEKAKEKYTYNDNADGLVQGTGKDYEVLNQARVKVGNDSFMKTEIVENPVPEKTETQAGDINDPTLAPKEGEDNTYRGPLVFVGDEIVYEIHWTNGHDEEATVTIVDPLDPGVDFVSAAFDPSTFVGAGGMTLGAQSLNFGESNTGVEVGGYGTDGNVNKYTIVYEVSGSNRVVTYNLGKVPAHSSGVVILRVRVNEKATPVGYVDNQATVVVNGDGEVKTEVIENPTPDVEKTEVTPGQGQHVMPGDQIHYQIQWHNYKDKEADVIVTDKLDPGVDFTSAGVGNLSIFNSASQTQRPEIGNLVIQMKAEEGADTTGEFTFTLTLTAPDGKELATYTWTNGENSGTVQEGKNEITLKVGETLIVKDLPVGTVYNITKEDGTPVLNDAALGLYGSAVTITAKAPAAAAIMSFDVMVIDLPAPASEGDIMPTAEGDDGFDAEKGTLNGEPATISQTFTDADGKTVRMYYFANAHTVVWVLEKREANDRGKVDLTVTVNDDADKLWNYDHPEYGPTENQKDDQVLNQAGVRVDNDATVKTKIIENPTEPKKTETQVNNTDVRDDLVVNDDGNVEGPEVHVGDTITYEITWQNNAVDNLNQPAKAEITITDVLDPNVEFVSASDGGHYDEATRTVTWALGEKDPRVGGVVTLTVRVTSGAVQPGKVENQATVTVGNKSTQTNKVENPVGDLGALTVKKTVTGDLGDKTKEWTFVVELSDHSINGDYGEMHFTSGFAIFTLRDGESKTASRLPAGITYTVTEHEANEDGYDTSSTGATGTIPRGDMARAEFVNHKETIRGNLTVKKTVTGTAEEPDAVFHFTVTFDPVGNFGNVTITKYDADGNATADTFSIDATGKLEFTLKDGESVTITGLPAGTTYTVTEEEFNENGYDSTSTGERGQIPENDTARAEFTNHKDAPTGGLTVKKTVTGTTVDPNAEFHFTVTFDSAVTPDAVQCNHSAGGATAWNGSTLTFTLKNGESVTITGLPVGTTYTVTETEFNMNGYTSTIVDSDDVTSDGQGTIEADDADTVEFINDKQTGSLTVSKTVTGTTVDPTVEFHFTVTFDPLGYFGDVVITRYDAEGNATADTFAIDAEGKLEFALKHGEHVTITGLPVGTTYTVTETEFNMNHYTSTVEDNDNVTDDGQGTIESGATDTVEFVNDKRTGDLTVSKTVTGAAGDTTKEWHFHVELSDKSINGPYGDMNFTEGVADFTLKHNESATATGLPAGITYTVTEEEFNKDGYDSTSEGETGEIPEGNTANADFVNHKAPPPPPHIGNLVVTKTVTGDAGDLNKEWHFHVELSDRSINGPYGDMNFTNGVADFTLRSGESATATGLPAGVTYTVTEIEANQDGYETSSTGSTGTIPDGGTARAEFVNHKDKPNADLTVEKTVTGTAGDKNKEWHFRVEISDKSVNGQYGDMFFTNGVAEFTLKHGESATATGLPGGITYAVTEAEADHDGYDTHTNGAAGFIPEGGSAKAEFVNHKEKPDESPKTGDNSRLGFWLGMMVLSLGGVVLTSIFLASGSTLVSNKGKHTRK